MWEAHMADDAAAATTAKDITTAEPAKDDAGKTFTQEQVNDLLARQKGDVQRKFSNYDDLKAKADKLAELESANQSEVEKLTGKLSKAEERANGAEGELLRFKVAVKKKLPAELIDRLQGSSEEELAADADELLELVKTPGEDPDFDGGPRETPPEPKTPEQQHNESALAVLGLKPNT